VAKAEGFLEIIVESDARVCVDALSCNVGVFPWTISALTAYSLELVVSFSTCLFSWVKREANQSAHVLAKVATSLCLPFCCCKDTLPPSVCEAWQRNSVVLFLLMNFIFSQKKKKTADDPLSPHHNNTYNTNPPLYSSSDCH
jgi:hypothetical protein